ncbi:ferredoxin/ferredoxin-NADP reductase [Acrasis kona]|uniref:Ferredoxin/ferredoxin-NADP reductase n=1 Tax=Acrasis kona TaxID=1008807 RepID=A0AAW2ZJW8_9EUKA
MSTLHMIEAIKTDIEAAQPILDSKDRSSEMTEEKTEVIISKQDESTIKSERRISYEFKNSLEKNKQYQTGVAFLRTDSM